VHADENDSILAETVALVKEVKEFGKTLGIEPSEALRRTYKKKTPHSIVWLWYQRFGTLALRTPIDIRTQMEFSASKEQAPLNLLYQLPSYSVYFRQGDQFGAPDSVITPDFMKDSRSRKVEVVLHEDLHDDKNFALVWEYEESFVNSLGILAALEFFKFKGDEESAKQIQAYIQDKREVSRQLNDLTQKAVNLFREPPLDHARRKVLCLIFPDKDCSSSDYAAYSRYYKNDLEALGDMNPRNLTDNKLDKTLVLEAKISHDFAYYRYFDRVVALYDKVGSFKKLFNEIKQVNKKVPDVKVPRGDINSEAFQKYWEVIDRYLRELDKKYKG
jgi:hypothetical protein